jgi:hypothetical protein
VVVDRSRRDRSSPLGFPPARRVWRCEVCASLAYRTRRHPAPCGDGHHGIHFASGSTPRRRSTGGPLRAVCSPRPRAPRPFDRRTRSPSGPSSRQPSRNRSALDPRARGGSVLGFTPLQRLERLRRSGEGRRRPPLCLSWG